MWFLEAVKSETRFSHDARPHDYFWDYKWNVLRLFQHRSLYISSKKIKKKDFANNLFSTENNLKHFYSILKKSANFTKILLDFFLDLLKKLRSVTSLINTMLKEKHTKRKRMKWERSIWVLIFNCHLKCKPTKKIADSCDFSFF